MKMAVIGAGGARSPLLARSITQRATKIGLNEVVFMDNNLEKLRAYGAISKHIAGIADSGVKFTTTDDINEAVRNADFIITTIRVGAEDSRVIDERIALRKGVLGQETTGAGGFAMAMRSIPALMETMKVIEEEASPDAIVFNFTNPSGLVTQALRDAGYSNVFGICDGPSEFIKELERLVDAAPGELTTECFGLNHLSWFRNIRFRGREITQELIGDPKLYKHTEMRFFDPELVRQLGVLPNGYLYYYYHREQAIANIMKAGKTRGETLKEINGMMSRELEEIDADSDFTRAVEVFLKYFIMRETSYMTIESGGTKSDKKEMDIETFVNGVDDGGYAGVALRFIESVTSGKNDEMVLLLPNKGSINGLRDDDVVEVTCRIGKNGATPVKIGDVDPILMNPISQVKLYERLSVEAIMERSVEKGRFALMAHPLVGSYSLAKELLGDYLAAHKDYVGEWV